ncbi:MAG TPA: hypothetical protein VM577_11225 [Anaerovoracaceae bacterium]|nr:hypothetical protein [Anaerovoracaceae bacterium]
MKIKWLKPEELSEQEKQVIDALNNIDVPFEISENGSLSRGKPELTPERIAALEKASNLTYR